MPLGSMVAWGSERALLGRFGIVTVMVGLCLLTLGLAGVREPWGGPELYRNLLVLAALLLSVAVVTSAWQRRRARPSP